MRYAALRQMDLQHLVSTHVSALVERLLDEQAKASLRHIQELREALDAVERGVSVHGDSGPEVQALTGRVTEAVAAEVRRVGDEAGGALDALREQLEAERAARERLASAAAEAGEDRARLAIELEAAREEAATAIHEAAARATAAAALDDERRAEIDRLTAALAQARTEAERLAADAQVERERADGACRDATALTAAAMAQDDARRGEIDRLTAALAEARSETERLGADLVIERERADAADQDLTVTIEAHGELEAALRQARAEARQAAQAQSASDAELAESRAAADRAVAETAHLRDGLARTTHAIAGLEARLTDALDAGQERDALAAELEARSARIQALTSAADEHETRTNDLETRLRDAAQAGAQLLEDLAARELALECERTAAREARTELDDSKASYEAASARVEALETELATARRSGDERDVLATRLDASAARIEALEAELAQTVETAREAWDSLAARLEVSLDQNRALEAAHAAQLEHSAQLQARLDEAAGLETRLREASASSGDSDALIEALRRDVDRLMALFDASVRGLTEMAGAKTSSDLLTELVKRLSIQFSRVALFRAKGDRLEGEQQIGFDQTVDLAGHALPLSEDSLPARAARGGRAESLSGDDVAGRTGLPIGGAPTAAVSLPIVLHDTTIAVVYADDAGVPEAARGPAVHESSVAFAQVLVSHVVAHLVRHTHELKTIAELRDYAATLLREAREMHLADVEGGKPADMVRSRLKENIDCASQLYAYRAAMEGTAAAGMFDEQIAEELAADTAFARDLAHVMNDIKEVESLLLGS